MGLTDDILLIYLLWGFVWLASAIHAAVVKDIALGFEYRPSGIWWTPDLGAHFLFRFLPTATLSMFGIIWPGADLFHRRMQPYAEMSGINVADKTILVDYLGAITPIVIISALSNRHWKVAWFALLSVTAALASTLAGDIFTILPLEPVDGYESFYILVNGKAFWASLAVLVLYCISLVVVRPTSRWRFPRAVGSLADMLTYCYASNLIHHPMFEVQAMDDKQIHLQSKIHLGKHEYGFGFYHGRDGRRHIGFDIVERQVGADSPENIDVVIPSRGTFHFWFGYYLFRKPPSFTPEQLLRGGRTENRLRHWRKSSYRRASSGEESGPSSV